MKSNIKILLSILICILILTAQIEASRRAKLILSSGDVTVKTENSDWADTKIGMVLEQGSVIKTGKQSFAILGLDDGSKIRLESKTEFKITSLSKENKVKKSIFNLFSGKVISTVKKLSKNDVFNIATPTAVAGVRGTKFVIQFLDGVTKIDVLEGIVDMWDPENDRKIRITANKGASFDGNDFPDKAIILNQEVLKNYKNILKNTGGIKLNMKNIQNVEKQLLNGKEFSPKVIEKMVAKQERNEQRRIDIMENQRNRTDFIDIVQNNFVNKRLKGLVESEKSTKLIFNMKDKAYKASFLDSKGEVTRIDSIILKDDNTLEWTHTKVDGSTTTTTTVEGTQSDTLYIPTSPTVPDNNDLPGTGGPTIDDVPGLPTSAWELSYITPGTPYNVENSDGTFNDEIFDSWTWVGDPPQPMESGWAEFTIFNMQHYN